MTCADIRGVPKPFKHLVRRIFYQAMAGSRPRYECPICGYKGVFRDTRLTRKPDLVRVNSKCLGCDAKERQRMMYLFFEEKFDDRNASGRSLLHIAPERQMTPSLRRKFEVYHTSDLRMRDVDYNDDVQNMSQADGTYDCVIISRVLVIPLDLEASVRELRRILRSGGYAVIAENCARHKTEEFGRTVNDRSRSLGLDVLDLYRKHFAQVDVYLSDRYDDKYHLTNSIRLEGKPKDDYPEMIRVPGDGHMELLAVCRA